MPPGHAVVTFATDLDHAPRLLLSALDGPARPAPATLRKRGGTARARVRSPIVDRVRVTSKAELTAAGLPTGRPMVPVPLLFASDVPGLPFPEGTACAQVLMAGASKESRDAATEGGGEVSTDAEVLHRGKKALEDFAKALTAWGRGLDVPGPPPGHDVAHGTVLLLPRVEPEAPPKAS